ncbi:MAG: SUMF1/EgtB/PvdO family nonheme iron enzyme, partial [bacterium]|nr:SUMF1/EgtB/PvdO family nonheme iron enzyme [bacterium]
RGVLHRDVTPRNILLAGGPAAELGADAERDPQVKLVDFGIAGLVKPSTFSQTSRTMGTMGYVAPEMFHPAPRVTPAADLYGVGAVTYELVTGQLPLGVFEPPSKVRAGLPPAVATALDSLLLDLLRRHPDERPDTEAALARFKAIEEQWEQERVRRREQYQAEEQARLRRLVSKPPTSKDERLRRRMVRIRVAFVGLVLVGLIGFGASLAWRNQVEKYELVRIPPGTFTMGSADDDPQADDDEKRAHEVTLSEFWIGKYEVTNEQYRQFQPNHRPHFEGAKLPANNVSWHEAKDFCESAGY